MNHTNVKEDAERVTGVSNVAYDVMVTLSNMLQGVAALQEYKRDAANDAEVLGAFERIEQQERDAIEELRGLLVARL